VPIPFSLVGQNARRWPPASHPVHPEENPHVGRRRVSPVSVVMFLTHTLSCGAGLGAQERRRRRIPAPHLHLRATVRTPALSGHRRTQSPPRVCCGVRASMRWAAAPWAGVRRGFSCQGPMGVGDVWRGDCLDGYAAEDCASRMPLPTAQSSVASPTAVARTSNGAVPVFGHQAKGAMRRRADGMTAEVVSTSLLWAEVLAQRGARVGGVACVGRRARALHTAGVAPPYSTPAACERVLRTGGGE